MKTQTKTLLSLLLLSLLLCLAACGPTDPWEDAVYTSDTTLGEGATTITVEVEVDTHLVTFTVNTDEAMLDKALTDIDLIAGDMDQYGLYVKVVNGITADYEVDASYWMLYINGEMASYGISSTEVVAGTTYRLSREK